MSAPLAFIVQKSAKAVNVLCSDGKRRTVLRLRQRPTGYSGRVRVGGKTVTGVVYLFGNDLLFCPDQGGVNAGILPHIPLAEYCDK